MRVAHALLIAQLVTRDEPRRCRTNAGASLK
jgi:hypothetical protein